MEILSTLAPNLASNFNEDVMNVSSSVSPKIVRHWPGPMPLQHVVKGVYVVGILMNIVAIVVLRRGERRVRNRKHLLLITSLAVNDLVALMGMLAAMMVSETYPWAKSTRAYCSARVVLRVFGIGSGCIAVTMAMERYLALTRPFVYQKKVTYVKIRVALLVSWFTAAAFTCLPIAGFGVYYDEAEHSCVRYRNAIDPVSYVYAVLFVIFGTLLCIVLVYFNLAVIKALYAISTPRSGGPVVRRVSKSSCRQRQKSINNGSNGSPQHNAATAEEVAFSRLMATLSVVFMICWMPQMLTSTLYLAQDRSKWSRLNWLGALSDVLMLFYYVINPILYLPMRRRFSPSNLCSSIAHCFKIRNHKTSSESMKTSSCCPQDTTLISESSGAEMRPLRGVPTAPIIRIED